MCKECFDEEACSLILELVKCVCGRGEKRFVICVCHLELWFCSLAIIESQDQLLWRWTTNGHYSSASAYRAFFIGRTSLCGAKDIWAASTPPKVKFFFRLALHGRLWTAERRRRHGLQAVDDCALCDQLPETTDHLLVACVFAREVWQRLLSANGLDHLHPLSDSRLVDWWQASRVLLPQQLR